MSSYGNIFAQGLGATLFPPMRRAVYVEDGGSTPIDDFLAALDTAGIKGKIDRIWFLGAATATAADTDLLAESVLTPVNDPVFTADAGYTTSDSAYLKLNFNPSTATSPKYAKDSAHFCFHLLTNDSANNSVEMGNSDGTANFGCNLSVKWSDGNTYFALNDANGDGGRAAPTDVSGTWIVSRTSSAGADAYHEGELFASNGQASTDVPTHDYVRGGGFSAAGTFSNGSNGQFAVVTIGAGLDATEAAALTSAIHALLAA
jgi:hypothetical protein